MIQVQDPEIMDYIVRLRSSEKGGYLAGFMTKEMPEGLAEPWRTPVDLSPHFNPVESCRVGPSFLGGARVRRSHDGRMETFEVDVPWFEATLAIYEPSHSYVIPQFQ